MLAHGVRLTRARERRAAASLESPAELQARAAAWDDLWRRSSWALPPFRAAQISLWLEGEEGQITAGLTAATARIYSTDGTATAPALAAERDASDAFVADNYAVLKEHRVFSALIPVDLGGSGATYSAMCAFLRRLAHYCPATALALAMHQHLVAAAQVLHVHGGQRTIRNGKLGAFRSSDAGGTQADVGDGSHAVAEAAGIADAAGPGTGLTVPAVATGAGAGGGCGPVAGAGAD
jgi:alkylation response protein AidB-like acyl-CoA dehydrogenase